MEAASILREFLRALHWGGMPVRVVLADDHVVVRQALKILLTGGGFEVVGEASDGREAVRITRELAPAVAVLDLMMPLLNGLEAAREIKAASPRTRTILLTSREDDDMFLEALRAGVRGCVLKTYSAEELVRAIRAVAETGLYLNPRMSKSLVDALSAGTPAVADPLSARERQVLQLIAEGKRTREIAQLLGVSVKTAESHRAHIMTKLGIGDVAGLVRYAIRRGIIGA